MEQVKINYNSKPMQLPRLFVTVDDLATMFNVNKEGMHLKYMSNNLPQNVWPSPNGRFDLPNVSEFYLVALSSPSISSSTPGGFTHEAVPNLFKTTENLQTPTINYGRRGNSGIRAVPGFKRPHMTQSPAPLKKNKKIDHKLITISGVDMENMVPYSIYEVPINLDNIKSQVDVKTIINEIRNQIGGVNYILTNKKGNPIRDMPNTRGR